MRVPPARVFHVGLLPAPPGPDSKAEALHYAQLRTRRRYPHSRSWAAFIFTSDPGLDVPAWRSSTSLALVLVCFAVGTFVFLRSKSAHVPQTFATAHGERRHVAAGAPPSQQLTTVWDRLCRIVG